MELRIADFRLLILEVQQSTIGYRQSRTIITAIGFPLETLKNRFKEATNGFAVLTDPITYLHRSDPPRSHIGRQEDMIVETLCDQFCFDLGRLRVIP